MASTESSKNLTDEADLNPLVAWRRRTYSQPQPREGDGVSDCDDFRDPDGEVALANLEGRFTEGWTAAAHRAVGEEVSDSEPSSVDEDTSRLRLNRASGVLAVVAGARKQAAVRKEQLISEDREAELRSWWG